jgi:predicted dehydrogenase
MKAPLRVAVVGAGIGRGHVEALREWPEHFDVRVVCDVDLERARAVAADRKLDVAILADIAARLKQWLT